MWIYSIFHGTQAIHLLFQAFDFSKYIILYNSYYSFGKQLTITRSMIQIIIHVDGVSTTISFLLTDHNLMQFKLVNTCWQRYTAKLLSYNIMNLTPQTSLPKNPQNLVYVLYCRYDCGVKSFPSSNNKLRDRFTMFVTRRGSLILLKILLIHMHCGYYRHN